MPPSEQLSQAQESSADGNVDDSHGRRVNMRWIIVATVVVVLLGLGAWIVQRRLSTGEMAEQDVEAQTTAVDAAMPRGQTGRSGTARRDSARPAVPVQAETADNTTRAGTGPATAPVAAEPSAVIGAHGDGDVAGATAHIAGPALIAIGGLEGVDLWDRPGGAPFLTLATGTRLIANGRSADGSWIFVAGDDTVGWTQEAQLIAFDLIRLPVITAAETPLMPAVVANGSADQLDSLEVVLVENPVNGQQATTFTDAVAKSDASMAIDSAAASTAVDAWEFTARVTLDDSRLNIRSGPGTGYSILDKAYPGEEYEALGRDGSGDWIQIELPGLEGGAGWVASEYIRLSGPASNLPLRDGISEAPESHRTEPQQASTASAGPMATMQTASITTGATGLTGTLVFQVSNGGTIYAYDLQNGGYRPLTYGFDPAISPDGRTVAFTRDGGNNGLYLIGIDGGNERLIFSGRAGLRSPTWSPDGNWIAFSRADEFTECRQIGRGGCVSDEDLAKLGRSPDDFPLVREYDHKLARVDINGSNYRDLATLESAQAPNWSKMGIVYQSDAGLQITDDVPNAVNQLVVFDYLKPYFEDPNWQPNGGRIVYQGREASHMEIFTINPDGSGRVALTRPATTLVDVLPSNVSPAWSPDGRHIVFLSNRDADHSAGAWQLWVMDADGGNQRPLPIDVSLAYSFGGEQMVSWGP